MSPSPLPALPPPSSASRLSSPLANSVHVSSTWGKRASILLSLSSLSVFLAVGGYIYFECFLLFLLISSFYFHYFPFLAYASPLAFLFLHNTFPDFPSFMGICRLLLALFPSSPLLVPLLHWRVSLLLCATSFLFLSWAFLFFSGLCFFSFVIEGNVCNDSTSVSYSRDSCS